MKRVHGTHVYTFLSCPRAVALDLHGDPAQRRPWTPAEELALARGREHEQKLVGPLGWPAPDYQPGDFVAGAAATRMLMAQGVPGLQQGVLLDGSRLGIPDLLRREPGASAFGAHHYVVGDVKSSARARGDQVLQVTFYARLLGSLQQRAPEYGFLWLKDGREERIALSDYDEVLDDVLARVEALAAGRAAAEDERPFLAPACRSCRWSRLCRAELEQRDDLSLVTGMTRGMRMLLERTGAGTVQALAELAVERVARETGIERRLLEQVRRAARARRQGHALPLELPAEQGPDGIVVHVLADQFAGQLLWAGALAADRPDGEIRDLVVTDSEHALAGLLQLTAAAPAGGPLWHWGGALPRWYDDAAHQVDGLPLLEARWVDLEARLRGAFAAPEPWLDLAGWVRAVLQRDPGDPADAGEAPLWVVRPGGARRIRDKGRAELRDLAALLDEMRRAQPA